MRLIHVSLAIVMVAGAAWAQLIPVTGVEKGATLKDIVGTPTLVTVVLKARGAKDPNLRIVEATSSYIAVLNESNDRYSYMAEDVQEIQVQGGKVQKAELQLPQNGALRLEEQKIVNRVWDRAREIFENANDNRELKITAATLLALNNDTPAKDYLKMLTESNDLSGQLEAAKAIYISGDEPPQSVVDSGLASGNRRARSNAAVLAGLSGRRDAMPILNTMMQDRSPELSAPAAMAMARMGNREIVPKLIDLLGSKDQSADAAVKALVMLDGPEVVEQMKLRIKTVDGLERYRVILVLYMLGDELGRQLLLETFSTYPTLQPEAALLLAQEKNWDATQYLRSRLTRREDPTESNLIFRARNAAALYQGGDPSSQTVFQELLRADNKAVTAKVCEVITEIGDRKLMTILQPTLENVDNQIALDAGTATVALGYGEFRKRLLETR